MFETKLISKLFSSEGATERVTLAEVKSHLYIEDGNPDFDTRLTALIKEVRQWCEEVTGLSLIDRTVTLYVDYKSTFTIPYGPLVSLTSAAVRTGVNEYEAKTANEDYELTNGIFTSYAGSLVHRLIYTAGYTSLPYGLKLAVLNEIARRFEHRGDGVIIGNTNELLQPYKMLEWLV